MGKSIAVVCCFAASLILLVALISVDSARTYCRFSAIYASHAFTLYHEAGKSALLNRVEEANLLGNEAVKEEMRSAYYLNLCLGGQ